MRQVMKFAAAMSVAAVAFAACGSSTNSGGGTGGGGGAATTGGASGSGLKVGMAYDVGGRGDQSFNDAAAAGLDKAVKDLGVQSKEAAAINGEAESARQERLQQLIDAGYTNVVAVGFAYAKSVGAAAKANPNVQVRHRRRRVARLGRPERRPDHLRRGAGLLPRRRGGGAEVQGQPHRLRRWRQHPPHQEVPGGLPGRREGGQPQHRHRRQVPHRAAGLLGLQLGRQGQGGRRGHVPGRAPTSSTTPLAARVVACSPRPRRRASSRSVSTPTRPRPRPRTSATSS